MNRFSTFPLSRQIIAATAASTVLAFGALVGYVSIQTQKNTLQQAKESIGAEIQVLANTVDFAEGEIRNRSITALKQLETDLEGRVRVSGRLVKTGSVDLPEMMMGDEVLNGSVGYLQRYKDKHPGSEIAFLVAHQGKLFRASTLLKADNGGYRFGSEVTDPYAQVVLAGRPFSGTIERSGKFYSLAVHPIRDAQGGVIGALSVRIDVDATIAQLKKQLGAIRVGKQGYFYIISTGSGDRKDEAVLVLHPKYQGAVKKVDDSVSREVFEKVAAEREGALNYEDRDTDGAIKPRFIVFREAPSLHWIIAAGTFVEDFNTLNSQLLTKLSIACVVLAILLSLIIGYTVVVLIRRLAHLVAAFEKLGRGDLAIHVDCVPGSANEIDRLADGLNRAVGSMGRLTGSIKNSVGAIQHSAAGLSASARDMLQAAESQSESASSMSASTEQLSVSIDHIAANAHQAQEVAQQVEQTVTTGMEVSYQAIGSMHAVQAKVRESLAVMSSLGEQSKRIGEVVGSIREVAEQTNLLALNAAIEAARAGEQGRGFAVVADEVRKLAEKAGHSTHEIVALLGKISDGVSQAHEFIGHAVSEAENGAAAAKNAEAALQAILTRTGEMVASVADIAHATQEQSAAAQSIIHQVEAISICADASEQSVRSSTETIGGLSETVTVLEKEVANLKC